MADSSLIPRQGEDCGNNSPWGQGDAGDSLLLLQHIAGIGLQLLQGHIRIFLEQHLEELRIGEVLIEDVLQTVSKQPSLLESQSPEADLLQLVLLLGDGLEI